MGCFFLPAASSAALRMERRQERAELTLVRAPRMPHATTIHMPSPHLLCSHTAASRKKTVGKMAERPNWPTYINSEINFMIPPQSLNIVSIIAFSPSKCKDNLRIFSPSLAVMSYYFHFVHKRFPQPLFIWTKIV